MFTHRTNEIEKKKEKERLVVFVVNHESWVVLCVFITSYFLLFNSTVNTFAWK